MSPPRTRMSNVDTAWWHMEDPTNLMMITSVMIFQGELDYGRLREVVEKRLLRFDRFRQRVVEPFGPLGGVYWEDDPHFTLDAHMRRVGLPAPADKVTLEEFVGLLMSTPLDYNKPLWQMHAIDNYRDGFVVVTRLHHCIADGIALMRVLLSLTDTSPDALWLEEAETASRRRRGRLRRLASPAVGAMRVGGKLASAAVREGRATLAEPDRLLEAARAGADFAARLGLVTLRRPDPRTLFKGALRPMKRATWSEPLFLEDIKAIGQVTGTTVNDVLVTAMAGGLRRYMAARGEETEGVSFRAYIPVNLRPYDQAIELGNAFGLVFLSMPVGIVDPLQRLHAVKSNMDELKNSSEAIVAIVLLTAAGLLPKEVENKVFELYHAKATAVFTNVPGPQEPLYMAGGRLQSMIGWVPQAGKLGLGISILSYNGEVLVGINCDAGLMPDPDVILTYFHEEFAELMNLVHVSRAAEAS